MNLLENEYTQDAVFFGKALLYQRKKGYRFNIDSVILGSSVAGLEAKRVLDAGCGSGIVGICAALTMKSKPVFVGLEAQTSLYETAQRNIHHNQLQDRYQVVQGDLRTIDPNTTGPFDLILLNPPYFAARDGLLNPDEEKSAARHEARGTLQDLLAGCKRLLQPRRGTLRIVYPANKLDQLFLIARRLQLQLPRLRFIHSTRDKEAYAVLADFKNHGRREIHIEPPLHIYNEGENYTPRLQAILRGEGLNL